MLAQALLCLVVGITDGDTLTARCPTANPAHPYQQVKVRLAEIDAPESGQAFGQKSKQYLSRLCFKTQATIRPTAKDRYGRTVARVECRGQDANLQMVEAGLAWAYTKYQTDPAFPHAELLARSQKIGLWFDPHALPPWEYRQHPPKPEADANGCFTGPKGGRYRVINGKKRYGTRAGC